MLRKAFGGCPGEAKVNRGAYRILNELFYNRQLTRKDWQQSVSPGSRLTMSIEMEIISGDEETCPRKECGALLRSLLDGRFW